MSVTLALLLDALIGDPPALWQRLPHPVALVGRLIAMFEALDDTQLAGAYLSGQSYADVLVGPDNENSVSGQLSRF